MNDATYPKTVNPATSPPIDSAPIDGLIVGQPMPVDSATSDRLISAGEYPDWLCQDWGCPSRDFCGRHFGLSMPYAEMSDLSSSQALFCPTRDELSCSHFVQARRDYFAESLKWQRTTHPHDGLGKGE